MSRPDLAGRWALSGVTLAPDGGTLYEWAAEMSLAPQGDAFAVTIETSGIKTSHSRSFAERLVAREDGGWQLRYGYEADPSHPASAGHDFFGLSQLDFAPDLQSAEGSSCNYNGRYVVTKISARRA